jgi:hypothetical protein
MRKGFMMAGIITLLPVILFQLTWAEVPKPETIAEKLTKFGKQRDIPKLRTENSRTYEAKDGKRTLFLATQPLNYQGDDGEFYPIDTNLVSDRVTPKEKGDANKRFRHKALKNVLRAQFSDNSDDGILLEHGAYQIQFNIRHKHRRTAAIKKNKIRYHKVFDNADLQYTVEPGRVKDELIFTSAPTSSILSFKVNFGKLKSKKGKNGTIELVDEKGKMIFTIAPSIMFEQGNKKVGKKIDTHFHWEKDQLYCDLILDMGWLKNPKRKYPVVIDPTASIYSSGTNRQRIFLRTPETNGNITFAANIDGPGWHGHLFSNHKSECYFIDRTTGTYFVNNSDYNGLSANPPPTPAQAGHEYEVGIYAGASYSKVFWENDHIGSGWATLTMDAPLFADQTIQGKNEFFTSIANSFTNYIVSKEFTVSYAQTISFSDPNAIRFYKDNVLQIIIGNKMKVTPGFSYRIDYLSIIANQIEVQFPYLTRNYESKIIIGSNPQYIESVIKVPANGQLLLKYETNSDNWTTANGIPSIKIYDQTGKTTYEKILDLDYYNQIIGGEIIPVIQEIPYHLKVSGRAGLTVYYQQNTPCAVTNLNLYDIQGSPASGFAQGNYGLRFNFSDSEENTLKEYKLTLQKTGETLIQEFLISSLQLASGQIIVPFKVKDLGYTSGDTVTYQIGGAWDGFDQSQTGTGFTFTLDTAPPTVIIEDRSLVNTDNTITLYFKTSDTLSGVRSQIVSWSINGNLAGSDTIGALATTYQIPSLPANAKVEVNLTAVDNVGNKAGSTLTYHTYPEKAQLVAPSQIFANPGNGFKANLKLSKVNASLYRVQRYRDQISSATLDYDSGYLDPSNLTSTVVGPPSVRIVTPTTDTIFAQPANVTITVDASDEDGKVQKVEFYADDQLIGTDLRSPYNMTWYKAAPGNHVLIAKAIDNDGLTTTSDSVYITVDNNLPRVSITGPSNNSTFIAPATITITAEAYDSDSTISKVEFYAGSTLIGTATSSPYRVTWSNVPAGNYTLVAKATDSSGGVGESVPVHILIDVPNYPGYVNITKVKTLGNNSFDWFVIMIDASDPDGINRVALYVNNSFIGYCNPPGWYDYYPPSGGDYNYYKYIPYYYFTLPPDKYSAAGGGPYTITTVAYDNRGAATPSIPITIRGPMGDETFSPSFNITRVITVGDYNFEWYVVMIDAGNLEVNRVALYVNNSFLGYCNSPGMYYGGLSYFYIPHYYFALPHEYNVYGAYTITAVAYDYRGVAISSISRTIHGPTGDETLSSSFTSPTSPTSTSSLLSLENTSILVTPFLQTEVSADFLRTPSLILEEISSAQIDQTQTGSEYYQLPDQPAQPHQTYVYRIYTKNGDKEVYQDSDSILVVNNIPEITSCDPGAKNWTYSDGTINISVQAQDPDGDSGLAYTYTLTPVDSITPYAQKTGTDLNKCSWISVPDGQYIWSVTVKDTYGGEAKTGGTIIVDKNVPVVKFNINNNNEVTNNKTVRVTVPEASNTTKIQLSNSEDFTVYQEYTDWNSPITWSLKEGDGVKIVYLKAISASGVSSTIQRQITLDTTAPSIANISIKAKGGDGQVSFNWSGGSDDEGGSGIAGSVIQLFKDGAWQSYATNYQNNFLTITGLEYNIETRIRIQLIDQAGNVSDWAVSPYGYSKAQAGSIEMANSSSGYSTENGHYIAIKINPVSGALQYYKILCTQNPGGGYSGEIADPGTPFMNSGLISHAEYKYVVLTYNENYEITESEEYTFTVANAAPIKPIASGPKGMINQNAGVRFSFEQEPSDPDNDDLKITYYYKTEGASDYTSQTSAILPDLGDGNYSWYATINDQNGAAVETEPVTFSIDNSKPEITIDNTSGDWASEHQIKIEASDSGFGLASLGYRINGGAYTTITSGGKITINNQGANSLEVMAIDKAGNSSSFQHLYFIDLSGPALSGFQWNLPEAGGKSLANNDQIPAQWNAGDPETGIFQFKYAWSTSRSYDPNNMQTLTLNGELGTYTNIFQGDFQDGQTYYLILQAQNSLGQISETIVSPALLYDHTAPLVTLNSLGGGQTFSGQYYLKDLSKLTADFEAEDPDTQISRTEYALIQKTADEAITWYPSLAELTSNVINPNTLYYLAIKVTNETGLSSIVYSQSVVLVNTPPELSIETPTEQYDTTSYNAVIKTSDPSTMVTKLEYAIGSTPDSNNLSMNLPGAANGWFNVTNPPQTLEIHQYADIPLGTTYYLTVKATNVAGLVTSRTSKGTTVTRLVNAPVVKDGGIYTPARHQLYFSWEFTNANQSIVNYEYRIKTDQAVVQDWTIYETSNRVSLTTPELNLINNTKYYCEVRAKFGDGSYSDSGISDGITTDFTAPVSDSFIAPAYFGAEGILLSWAVSDPESGINCYLGLGASPGQTDLTEGWVPVGSLKTYQLNRDVNHAPISFTNGAKYYATLMMENGSGLTIQKNSPVIICDLTPPPTPVVLDEGKYTNHNDILKANWKWTAEDNESGIREYQYTITNQRSLDGGEIWFTNGTAKEAAISQVTIEGQTINLSLINGKVYYIAVKAINNAGGESVGFSDGILIDTEAPDPPVVVDYGDYSLTNNSLRASMVSSDAQTGVAGYKLSLGVLRPDGTIDQGAVIKDQDVLSPSGGSGEFNGQNLNLQEGQVYFFTIIALDNAGNISMESMSDGIMVDTQQPQITKIITPGRYLADPTGFNFDWELTATPSGVAGIRYAIGDNPNGSGLTWQETSVFGSKKVSGLNLTDGGTYYIYLKTQSIAARETNDSWSAPFCSDSVTIDTTPPEVIAIITPADGQNSRHFLLQWEARDTGSGITEYRYAVGSTQGGTDVNGGWVHIKSNQNNLSFYRDDLPLDHSSQYFIAVMAKNGAGLWSTIYQSKPITVDLTPPVITQLEYGAAYLRSRSTIGGITWAASDPETGIQAYRIKTVQTKDVQTLDVSATLTGQNAGVINLTGLNLEEAKTYYIAMQFQNGVGDWSGAIYSNGFIVDTVLPVITIPGALPELATNSGQLEIAYEMSEPGTVAFQLTAPNGRIENGNVTVQAQTNYSFNQTLEGKYTLILTPTDLAGNMGTATTQIIRLNAKPRANIGPDLVITKGTTVRFNPEVSDSDGQVVQYQWDFGNGETSNEARPSCSYKVLGDYIVTLIVTDNEGKPSDVSLQHIKVTNTSSGELTMDENWYGPMEASGDIIVPQGKVLTMMAGTQLTFNGNYQIKVFGKLIIEGTAANPVMIGDATTIWNGIRLESCDPGSRINYAIIEGASAGLVVYRSQAAISGCVFKKNNIGLHVLACNPLVQNSAFQENLVYGIKEDDGASPAVTGCVFSGNIAADYYEDKLAIISMDTLNELGSNSYNRVQQNFVNPVNP